MLRFLLRSIVLLLPTWLNSTLIPQLLLWWLLPMRCFSMNHRPRGNLTLQVKGARFHMDFGFFNVPSVRGFNSFLVIVEAVTSYTWVFLRRNKNPPIALWIWFREYITKTYRVPALAWRTDNGGELWKALAATILPARVKQ
jgi:hypothetical protein